MVVAGRPVVTAMMADVANAEGATPLSMMATVDGRKLFTPYIHNAGKGDPTLIVGGWCEGGLRRVSTRLTRGLSFTKAALDSKQPAIECYWRDLWMAHMYCPHNLETYAAAAHCLNLGYCDLYHVTQ